MDAWKPIKTIPPEELGPVLIWGVRWRFDWAGERDEAFAAVCERFDIDEEWTICNTTYYSTDCLEPVYWQPVIDPDPLA